MNMLDLQLGSATLCMLSCGLNLQQAMHWRRERKRFKAIAKIMLRDDGERQLGIVGSLPEPGTILYVMDASPPKKKPDREVLTI
jgi:hypothetical protein